MRPGMSTAAQRELQMTTETIGSRMCFPVVIARYRSQRLTFRQIRLDSEKVLIVNKGELIEHIDFSLIRGAVITAA